MFQIDEEEIKAAFFDNDDSITLLSLTEIEEFDQDLCGMTIPWIIENEG